MYSNYIIINSFILSKGIPANLSNTLGSNIQPQATQPSNQPLNGSEGKYI